MPKMQRFQPAEQVQNGTRVFLIVDMETNEILPDWFRTAEERDESMALDNAGTKDHADRPYWIRRAERMAKHAPALTHVERTLIASVRSHIALKLRGINAEYALDVVNEAIVNANDTVLVERARERSEWGWMFVCSMESLLADGARALDLASKADLKRVRAVFKLIDVEG